MAVLIAIVGFKERPANQAWSVLLILMALLFNPFVPIRLDRATWLYLDRGAAAVFLAHLFLVRLKIK